MLQEEINKFNKPLEEIDPKDLEPKPITEYLITDKTLLKEYKDFDRPFKQRFKYTVFFDVIWFMGIIVYARNVNYYASKFYPKKRKGLGNLLLISFFHCGLFVVSFALGNLIILGINPVSYYKKKKILNEKLLENDPCKGMSMKEFMLMYSDIQELEEKKAELKKKLLESKRI
jgi:hypothetical protein